MASAWFNVIPHYRAWMAEGWLSDAGGLTFFAAASVLFVAFAPFFLKKTTGVVARAIMTAACLWFIALNFLNVLDHIAQGGDSEEGSARHKIEVAHSLERRISALRADRQAMPPFTRTTQAEVDAAQASVTATEAAREIECKSGVGQRCVAKDSAVLTARAGFVQLTAQLGFTNRADELDSQIFKAQADLSALGPLPKYEESTSTRFVRFLAKLTPMPADFGLQVNPNAIMQAMGFEFLALLGPFMVMSVLEFAPPSSGVPKLVRKGATKPARKPGTKLAGKSHTKLAWLLKIRLPSFGAKPEAPLSAPPPLSALSVSSKPLSSTQKRSRITDNMADTVRNWMAACVLERRGEEMRATDAYSSYHAYCEEHGFAAVTSTAFGRIMTERLGVEREKRGNWRYYKGVSARRVALRVVN